MIRVNLLPEEYRPTEGASWSVLLTFIVAILVVAGAGVFALFVQFRSSGLEDHLKAANAQAVILKDKADEHDRLQDDIDKASARKDTIEEIAQSKINWAKKLDELTDLLLEDEMWIHELELREGDKKPIRVGGEAINHGSLRITCFFVGDAPRLVDAFYRQVTGHRSFFSIFEEASLPQTTTENITDFYKTPFIPDHEENLASTLELYLKGPPTRDQQNEQPPKKQPPKPAN